MRPPPRWKRIPLVSLVSFASPLALLAVWEVAARSNLVDTRFFPAPSSTLAVSWQMLQPSSQYPAGELQSHLGSSLGRIAIGYCIGAATGVVLGIVMGLLPIARAVLQPLVDATFPIPKVAILPLLIMVLGIGEESKFAVVAVAVVYVVLINTMAGVRNIDAIYLDVAKNYQVSPMMLFTDIALPGALPMIVAGLRLGMGVALLVIVAAEFVGAKSGIGYLIWTSWQVFQVEKMYVGLMVVALLGFGTSTLLNRLEWALIPWKRTARSAA